ncbi:MAG: PaaI family thioesterase [Flavobacteriales bacterium]|jgi:uncharacterized protein (TIGR00369 family)|nr:PaaI family thioesterase [Flavobacteriales bacterium]MDG1439850.1 PaaI family thioesterase [Flavobacteriales bacterium]
MNVDILKKYNQTNLFGKYLDLQLDVVKPGNVSYKVKVKKQHLATVKSAHGGFISAIFDQIVGTAALSKAMVESKLVSTIEFKINYLQPAILHDELIGNGIVIKNGKRIYTVKGDIYNQKKELIATGIATLNAYPYEKSDMNFK